MRKQTASSKMRNRLWAFLLLFSLSFSGCGRQEADALQGSANSDNPSGTLAPETEALFCQILLFLQEGFCRHNIHKTYQVYFTAPKEIYTDDNGNTTMNCKLLLKEADSGGADAVYWEENLYYTFDGESGWYTFTSQYEPVMTQNDSFALDADFSSVKEVLENCIYHTALSPDTVVDASARYYAASGPVISDSFFTTSSSFPVHKPIRQYTYRDERMEVYVTILYPALYVSDPDLKEILNARIRDAFFYGYDWDAEPNPLMPEKEIFTIIERSCFITREDEQYFSVRIYEYNESRRAAHPNEWETGLTLSMTTGAALTLRDIVGEKYTVKQLLDSGAFHCMWGDLSDYVDAEWLAEEEEALLAELKEEYQYRKLEDFDTDFYLTDDSLGLIVTYGYGDEYICIEAKLSDLGLDEWIATPPADR